MCCRRPSSPFDSAIRGGGTRLSRRAQFASVVLDVDSTLCGIEGVDWLAKRRGAAIAESSARLTDRAMNGEIPVESVYGERLALIRPTFAEIEALADEYRRTLAPGAARVVSDLRAAKVKIVLLSGGIRRAIEPVASDLGFEPRDLVAVDLYWNPDGQYAGFDDRSPLATNRGKLQIVRTLALKKPTLAVGDGATDLAMREAVDAFAAFTGFIARENVVPRADFVVANYDELAKVLFA